MPRAGLDAGAVVDAAAALADEAGLSGLTLAALAARLGVRTPSLYAHVDGLPQLRALLAQRGACELSDAIRTAAAGRAGPDALREVAHAYRDYARRHPGTYAAMQAPDDRPENVAAARELVELIAAVLRGYALQGDAVIHAIRAVRSALHGFVALERAGGFAMPYDVEESFTVLLTLLDAGLRAPAVAGSAGPD